MKGKLTLLGMLFALMAEAEPHDHAGHSQPGALAPEKKAPLAEERVPVEVPAAQQEKMGLRTAIAKVQSIEHTIRTVGTVTADETKEAHVHTKINGWIERIYADYVGKPVKKGQALFDLYAPDLVSTQEEYLAARRQGEGGRELAKVALERLSLWGVPGREIERLKKAGAAKRAVTFHAPVSGTVIRKTAIQGMYITPEMELYHIADLSRVWVVASLYEYDLAAVSQGDAATLELPFQPGKPLAGKIGYIYPEVDAETRTARARIEMDNPRGLLKPGMFANVTLKKNLGDSISVPDDAVIDTGARKVVFVKTAAARFEPREVVTGARVGHAFVILAGLKAGDEVVTSAHFLLDAESKLQAAERHGEKGPGGHGGHGK